MKSFLRRAGWAFMAMLFIVTGLGVGLVAFWQATHDNNSTTDSSQQSTATNLQGTKLSGFTPTESIKSLQKVDLKTGSGAVVKNDSTIIANYTGAVAATGVVFQSSLDNGGQPFTAKLNDPSNPLIKGWDEGLPGMKAGGERRLLIPAALAYGADPPANSGIPANADLVFDISVIAVQ